MADLGGARTGERAMAVRDEAASAHDPESGQRGGEPAVGAAAASQYGAAERGGHARPGNQRAWALGAVVLSCALVAAAHLTQHPAAADELVARGRKFLAGHALALGVHFDPPDMYVVKKMSFTKGEAHMINDVFHQDSTKDELSDPVYRLVRPELLEELQHEIELEMEEEVQEAVKKEQQEYYLRTTATIQKEMGAVMDDVDKQKKIDDRFHAMVKRAKELESGICQGASARCDNWDALLAGAQKKVDALKKQLAAQHRRLAERERASHQKDADESALVDSEEQKAKDMEKELSYWHGLSNVYYAMLHPPKPQPAQPAPRPPPPPHCSGLKTIYGATGSISTGPAGTATEPEHNDCRWIIKSPSAEIVLRFPNVKLMGSDSRVSIFVGPENVALYKNEDVINWASAYKSFTGSAYPAPIVCHSDEVHIVLFQSLLSMRMHKSGADKRERVRCDRVVWSRTLKTLSLACFEPESFSEA